MFVKPFMISASGGAIFGFNASAGGVGSLNFSATSAVTGTSTITLAVPAGTILAQSTYTLFTDASGGPGNNTFTLNGVSSVVTGGVLYPVSLSSTATANVANATPTADGADTVSANLRLATIESFVNNSTNAFTVTGAIGSTAAGTTLTYNGSGTGGFAVSGANTDAGATVVAVPVGTAVTLGSGTALGNASNAVTVTSGTLNLTGGTVADTAGGGTPTLVGGAGGGARPSPSRSAPPTSTRPPPSRPNCPWPRPGPPPSSRRRGPASRCSAAPWPSPARPPSPWPTRPATLTPS